MNKTTNKSKVGEKLVLIFLVIGVLYLGWYFAIYLRSADSCDAKEGMAVHSVYPWGVKCTSYQEAFNHWNKASLAEARKAQDEQERRIKYLLDSGKCKWSDAQNPYEESATLEFYDSDRGLLFCKI